MAKTQNQLTNNQREEQIRISAKALEQTAQAWKLLDISNIRRTYPTWVSAMLSLILGNRQDSENSAWKYYTRVRTDVLGTNRHIERVVLDAPARELLETSLRVTGPGKFVDLTRRGLSEREAAAKALESVSGAVTRQVMDGGRDFLIEQTKFDHLAIAFARIAKPGACAFCALMASRGAVYHSRDSVGKNSDERFQGGGEYKFHDHCRCTIEPVFTEEWKPNDLAKKWDKLYQEASKGESDKLNAFRRAYQKQLRESSQG